MAVREEGVDSVRVQVSSVPSISANGLSSWEQFWLAFEVVAMEEKKRWVALFFSNSQL